MAQLQNFEHVKELSVLVAVVANDQTLGLTLDGEGMSYIDFEKKHITLSDRLVPKNLRKHPAVVRKFRQAMAQHEAQHWVFTRDMIDEVKSWIHSRPYPDIAASYLNFVDDYRVNTWLAETYSWDIGQRTEWMVMAFGHAWDYTLKKMLKKEVKDGNDNVLLDPLNWLTQGVIFVSLYGVDVEAYRTEWAKITGDVGPDELVEAIKQISEKIWESKYTPSDRILELAEQVYSDAAYYAKDWFEREPIAGSTQQQLKLKKNARPPSQRGNPGGAGTGKGEGCPHGTIPSGGPINQQYIPGHLGGKAETEAPPGGGQGGDGKGPVSGRNDTGDLPDSPGTAYATLAGKGAGIETPTPTPNEGRYNDLVNRNYPHIVSLLDKLKRLMQPKLKILKFQKSGKLMSKQLARMSVQRRPVENIFSRKKFYTQKQQVKMCLVVDMSGSMSTEQARDALTTISEVGGRWLDDDDMAIFIFGDHFKKVKAFGESYRNTRARIGGVQCMGGTMASACLDEVHRMFNAYGGNKKKVCVIVSDFCIFDPNETHAQLKLMHKDGIIPVGVGFCGTRIESVREYTGKNSTYVRQVSELPGLFFDVFRRASL